MLGWVPSVYRTLDSETSREVTRKLQKEETEFRSREGRKHGKRVTLDGRREEKEGKEEKG